MPRFEIRNLKQTAQLWPKTGQDEYTKTIVGDRQEIKCRWEWTESQMVDQEGKLVRIDATVAVAIDITIGSLIWLGKQSELLGSEKLPPGNVMEVVAMRKADSIKSTEARPLVRRELGLRRYMNSI